MRKRNHTVTIRMNKAEYELLQSKVKESGRTQQEVVIKAIADLKIASTEEVEELKRLNQMFADILSQLRGATTNINQIARKLHTDGEIPNDSMLYFLNKNILKYRKESEKIWLLIRRLISGQIHMEQWILLISVSSIAVIGDVVRKYFPINLILLLGIINIAAMEIKIYCHNKGELY